MESLLFEDEDEDDEDEEDWCIGNLRADFSLSGKRVHTLFPPCATKQIRLHRRRLSRQPF